MTGWKTKTGTLVAALGSALYAATSVAPTPEIGSWCQFIGTIFVGLGGALGVYGIGDKVDKLRWDRQG